MRAFHVRFSCFPFDPWEFGSSQYPDESLAIGTLGIWKTHGESSWPLGHFGTEAHAGCFGEDLAKCICWNLVGHERTGPAQLLKLLQYYHYQLLKCPFLTPNFEFENISSRKLQALGASADLQKGLTLDKVQAAYQR